MNSTRQSRSIRAVNFDIDNTLYDSNAAQIKLAEVIRQKFPRLFEGIEEQYVLSAFMDSAAQLTVDYYSGQPSIGLRERRFRYFLQLLGLNVTHTKAIEEVYLDAYSTIDTPIPGAVRVVRELGRVFLLGVISNSPPEVQYKKLDAIGLREAFSCIMLSEEVGIRKPDPRIFYLATDVLKVQAAECVYVGDSYAYDVVGAKAAGMKACWFNPKSLPSDGFEPKVDIEVKHLEEFPELFNRLC